MARVPDEAIRRSEELTKGAWNLYVRYCSYRNRDTGRCDPGLELLAGDLKRTPRHVSDMKTELVRKGWVRRTGKNAVELLVGDFGGVKVRTFGKNPTVRSENFRPTGGPSSEGIRTQVRKESERSAVAPISEPVTEPVAAVVAAAGGGISHPEPERDEGQLPCDAAYVAEVKARGHYPPEFVEYVWRKLLKRCAADARASGFAVAPVRRQFDWWLENERAPAQPTLPGVAPSVGDIRLRAGGPYAQPPRRCDATCTLCFGTGYERMPEGGVRKGCSNAAARANGTEG